jgi:hypothetical protein
MRENPSVPKQPRPAAAERPSPETGAEPSLAGLGALLHQAPSWLVSMVFHVAILLVLALWVIPEHVAVRSTILTVLPGQEIEDAIEVAIPIDIEPPPTQADPDNVDVLPPGPPSDPPPGIAAGPGEPAGPDIEVDIGQQRRWLRHNVLTRASGPGGPGGLHGRDGTPSDKLRMDATPDGERAVATGLAWLAAHQMPDGGWGFNHAMCPNCKGQCRNPGTLAEARIAATGMALLPFLGAGQTHKNGRYKATVRAGLYFLVNHMKLGPQGGALNEPGGRMYAQGIAAIAICEAFAMTRDKGLCQPAQQAINFICYAQDPVGGGWRYEPRQKGDTSVVGWQIMALKSGHLAYLRVPPATVKKAFQFLDTVQANSGANYGYVDPGSGQATTAIGLLCRMYLGWKKDNPALARGVEWLGQQGPSPGNMYYNYYASQVMRHWDGDEWIKWNNPMRDQLVKSQATLGHEKGSWHMNKGDHGADVGGRLYCTAMAVMILEVPYRMMPIYDHASVQEDFPD